MALEYLSRRFGGHAGLPGGRVGIVANLRARFRRTADPGQPIRAARAAGDDLVAVVGGLVVSQLLTLHTIPVTYLYMERFSEWIGRLGRRGRPGTIPHDHAVVPANRFSPPSHIYPHPAE
jgi:hypothetical protein